MAAADGGVGNTGSAQLGSGHSGGIPKGSTPVGNPATIPSGGSGPIKPGGKMKPNA